MVPFVVGPSSSTVPVLPVVSVELGEPGKLPGGVLSCGEGKDNTILWPRLMSQNHMESVSKWKNQHETAKKVMRFRIC